jgi:NAD kinase
MYLVVPKKSLHELHEESTDPRIQKFVATHPAEMDRLRGSREAHEKSLERIFTHLEDAGVPFDVCDRAKMDEIENGYEAVLSCGGDGTVIDTAHAFPKLPIIGVNTHPAISVGFICGYTADDFIGAIHFSSTAPVTKVRKLQVELNGEVLPEQALNEVMISYYEPGPALYGELHDAGKLMPVPHPYSLIVAKGAGSTGGNFQVGGEAFPLESDIFSYIPVGVRGAVQNFTDDLTFVSRVKKGVIAIDPHWRVPFGFDDTIRITQGNECVLYGDLQKKQDEYS